jgi:Family of unknown function (DUF6760)
MRGYPVDQIYDEVAFIAYHFHWSRDDILGMVHSERRRCCEEISKLNAQENRVQKTNMGVT